MQSPARVSRIISFFYEWLHTYCNTLINDVLCVLYIGLAMLPLSFTPFLEHCPSKKYKLC